jgi:protein TonB
MSVSTACLDGHELYLHGLDRTLRVAIVASLAVHLAFLGLLPSPFHHAHPTLRTLEVNLVEARVPPPEPEQPPAAESPAPLPIAPAARPKPERAPRPKTMQPPKPVRERAPQPSTPTAPEREPLLTHGEPEKAVTSVPALAPSAEGKLEKDAAAETKAQSVDTGPVVPPSLQAGYLRNPEPPYPTVSRRLGEEGTVQLRVQVSAEGHAVRVDIHRSSGFPRLDETAAAAVREWRFVPAKRGTTPVAATVIVPIVFRLEAE